MSIITGSQIDHYRLLVLRAGLRLELKGMKRHGRSCYSILKQDLGLRGSRESVLAQVNALLGLPIAEDTSEWVACRRCGELVRPGDEVERPEGFICSNCANH